jgi:hypothetical protein
MQSVSQEVTDMEKKMRRGLGWLRKIAAVAPVALAVAAAYGFEFFSAALRGNSWG